AHRAHQRVLDRVRPLRAEPAPAAVPPGVRVRALPQRLDARVLAERGGGCGPGFREGARCSEGAGRDPDRGGQRGEGMMRALWLGAALVLATGCDVDSRFWQRMEVQPKEKAYFESEFYADGRAMRQPPEGTISREAVAGNPALTEGAVDGQLVDVIPLELNENVLARGKKKFDIVCAQCHGQKGDGNSIVAENMGTRLPPDLLAIADRPAGYFYQAIAYGYGLMPSFAGELNVEDRWAVVAYIRALQKTQNVPLADAPAAEQQR